MRRQREGKAASARGQGDVGKAVFDQGVSSQDRVAVVKAAILKAAVGNMGETVCFVAFCNCLSLFVTVCSS
jgi:hypothetical protein